MSQVTKKKDGRVGRAKKGLFRPLKPISKAELYRRGIMCPEYDFKGLVEFLGVDELRFWLDCAEEAE